MKMNLTKAGICLLFLLGCLTTNAQGPNAPEASGFEPVSATDMVNLSSGDMVYVLPLLEIDGFPVTLSYHAGIPMEMEASWVGLGWNINTGAIARGVVSTPDDWNRGIGMKMTYYYVESETFTVNVGVGFAKAASVGVGLSWGSNKSLSGSVAASVGPIAASIDTDGNYSVGLNTRVLTQGMGFDGVFDTPVGGSENSGFGGSLSISGNTKQSGIAVGANAGYQNNGRNVGLGMSLSGNGTSYSIGGGAESADSKNNIGGGGSIGSFSAGDMNISSKGFYIPISIGIFNFGFGYQKQKISYAKGLNRYGFGSLYHGSSDLYNVQLGELNETGIGYDGEFNDFQRRNYYGDIYDQELPQNVNDFIGDRTSAVEKINFTFVGYDSYSVNATGLSGGLNPLFGEQTVLIGEGFEGDDSGGTNKKKKVYYHNSNRGLAPSKSLQNHNLYFSFDGQITNQITVGGSIWDNDSYDLDNFGIEDFINRGTTYMQRPTSGSYVEVFTNEQLDGSDFSEMLLPASLYRESGAALSRVALGYVSDGIGGYKITAPDGKVYHFSQPVYQYEKIEHSYIHLDGINKSPLNSTSKRSATPYATHWLLTAITGPDYIDDGNNFPDEGDLGYWLRLDHGQWSNAYVWRTPYANEDLTGRTNSITVSKDFRMYATYNENNVDKVDAGHFLQGRKDLYYLDKIVSKNQVAYFVKSIRKDGLGTDLDYDFYDDYGGGHRVSTAAATFDNEIINAVENARYDTEYLLRLDQIIIEKNNPATRQAKNQGNGVLNGIDQVTLTSNRYHSGGIFDQELPGSAKQHKLHQSDNIFDENDFIAYDYGNALKVIQLNYNYELAKGSINTSHTNQTSEGRLSLKSIKFYGRDLWDYMPPYLFDYKRIDQPYSQNNKPSAREEVKDMSKKDSWGFIEGNENDVADTAFNRKTLADSWSLNKITTPQGSTIEIDYEEDDFYVEAFSRRYWEDNLKFQLDYVRDQDLKVEIYNDNDQEEIDFRDYFDIGDTAVFDFWAWLGSKLYDLSCLCSSSTTVSMDIPVNEFVVVNVSNDRVVLKVKVGEYNYQQWRGSKNVAPYRRIDKQVRPDCFLSKPGVLYNCEPDGYTYSPAERGHSNPLNKNDRLYNLQYKLLASKSPKGNSGGGLKVAKITVNDASDASYITAYDYKVPGTNKSSGITSFYPVYGTKFVPYQNELPGPGVMYEWVTMKAIGYDYLGNELPSEETRYHYYTLQPILDIFNPNFTMTDTDGEVLFKASVADVPVTKGNITAKEIHIEKNLGKIGQLISTEHFNSERQLLNKTTNDYIAKNTSVKESFSALKSIYSYDYDQNNGYSNRTLKNRLLSVSSKSENGQILKKVTSVTPHKTASITYENLDPVLGSYRTSIKSQFDGTKIKETKYPAYEVYPDMGSKTDNPNNKNMLTQEAMHVRSVLLPREDNSLYIWETINATVSTWSDDWLYQNNAGETEAATPVPVWRKQADYVWKDNITENGTYGNEIEPYHFDWDPGVVQTYDQWQKVSEITRYSHWSTPLETEDSNGNNATVKMADNWSKTIAVGNARYSELFYCGAEYIEDNGTFSGGVSGVLNRVDHLSHTGKYALRVASGEEGYKVVLRAGEHRAGTYKLSVWMYETECLQYDDVQINHNGVLNSINGEIVKAGNWVQLIHYLTLTDLEETIFITTTNDYLYFDDFRLSPVSTSMTSYVYDSVTDELITTLDANNMGIRYVYDKAGRLCKTFNEISNGPGIVGGFRLSNQYDYSYKGFQNSENCSCCVQNVMLDETPVATDDAISLDPGETKTARVLANDNFGLDGAHCSPLIVVQGPTYGTYLLDDNGTVDDPTDDTISYTADSEYEGDDSLRYEICDRNNNCDQGLVIFHIQESSPIAIDDFKELDEEVVFDMYPLINDEFGADGPSLSDLEIIAQPANGVATVNTNNTANDPTDDFISVILNGNFYGEDSLTYRICDADGDCATANSFFSKEMSTLMTIPVFQQEYYTVDICPINQDDISCYKVSSGMSFLFNGVDLIEPVVVPYRITMAEGIGEFYDYTGERIEYSGNTIFGYEIDRSNHFDVFNYFENCLGTLHPESNNIPSGEFTIYPGEYVRILVSSSVELYNVLSPTNVGRLPGENHINLRVEEAFVENNLDVDVQYVLTPSASSSSPWLIGTVVLPRDEAQVDRPF